MSIHIGFDLGIWGLGFAVDFRQPAAALTVGPLFIEVYVE